MDRERLDRIRNFQSKDWYPAVFMRPLTIAVMWVVADWRWLTPNRLTTLANVTKLTGAGFILVQDWTYTVAAVVLLQVGLLFDHMDGTLARYRRSFSGFGSFYDKVSDGITWFCIAMAVGWVAYRQSGEAYLLVLAATGAYSLLTLGYMKWVAGAETAKVDWHRAARDPEIVARKTAPPVIPPPPRRSAGEWLRWFGWSMLQVVRFEETDLFFWVGLALLTGRLELVLWLMAVTQPLGVAIMLVKRGLDVHRADREIATLRDDHGGT